MSISEDEAPAAAGAVAMADDAVVLVRRREIATEHILFKLIDYVDTRHPGLLDHIEASLDHLGDRAHDETKDDEAVREIVRRMIAGARRLGGA